MLFFIKNQELRGRKILTHYASKTDTQEDHTTDDISKHAFVTKKV